MNLNEFNPELYQEKYRIKSTRLSYWDYSSDGYYFITICTKNRVKYFGDVHNYIMGLSDIGCIAVKFWQEIPKHFPNVHLDEFVVMPNHVHGIIQINNNHLVDTLHCNVSAIDDDNFYSTISPKSGSLSAIIRSFKSIVTKTINQKYPDVHFQWQPRFYDHIIRNEKSLNEIRKYIYDNPEKWEMDRNNTQNLWM